MTFLSGTKRTKKQVGIKKMKGLASTRRDKIKDVLRFIETCGDDELVEIIQEIVDVHDNLTVWNPNHKCLDSVVSVCLNCGGIQLNISEEEGGN